MRALWDRDEALRATGGRAEGADWQATGISIDSRTVGRGDLFVALAGPRNDGHDYVGEALARGAVAALVHRRPERLPADAPLLLVGDTLAGLRDLAAAARARSEARVVAVTGSVGKTGTKEMLRLALGQAGMTHASEGSLNNHWGVPLSLARMPRCARYAVFELGMNHPGEIEPLSRLVRPEVAIITAIAPAHLEFFASTTEIAAAKAEIFLGVTAGGAAILPRDTPHYEELRAAAAAAGIARILSFGAHIEAQARLLHAAAGPTDTVVSALLNDRPLGYRLGLSGRQWAANSLAVLLAADAVGVAPEAAVVPLAHMTAPKGRGSRRVLPWRGGGVEIIDESYNASPAAMAAAIATLAVARPGPGGRRIAVLGDMLELGAGAPQLHAGLARILDEWRIDLVFTAGPLMRHLHDALPLSRRGGHAETSDGSADQLRPVLRPGDVVMVKGSAGSRMGHVVRDLEEAASRADAVLAPAAGG